MTGPVGPHGPQGIQGPPGPQGPQGIQGPPGTLSDYTEGIWTPILTGSSVLLVLLILLKPGLILNWSLVICNFLIVLTSLGTISGNVIITGIPFTASAANGIPFIMIHSSFTSSPIYTYAVISPSSSQIFCRKQLAGFTHNVSNIVQADLTNDWF